MGHILLWIWCEIFDISNCLGWNLWWAFIRTYRFIKHVFILPATVNTFSETHDSITYPNHLSKTYMKNHLPLVGIFFQRNQFRTYFIFNEKQFHFHQLWPEFYQPTREDQRLALQIQEEDNCRCLLSGWILFLFAL